MTTRKCSRVRRSNVKPLAHVADRLFTRQTFAAIWASGIVPPSIIDSEFLDRLRVKARPAPRGSVNSKL